MLMRMLCISSVFLALVGCQGDSGGDSSIDLDCRSPGRACPVGSECIVSSLGTYGCVRISIMSDAGPSDSPSDTDAMAQQSDGGLSTDSGPSAPLTCPDLCDAAITCLYDAEQCRRLTPGEERDVRAACVSDCESGAINAQALAGASCADITTAVVGTTQDLATLCGIAAADQPCRTADGIPGVCVAPQACTGTPDDSRCLGESVCCTGISCGNESSASGTCVGRRFCDGQVVEGDCPGIETSCCVPFNDPGSACDENSQCASDNCATEMSTGRTTPGGFCETACESDNDCGSGSLCIGSGGGGLCFSACTDDTPCRDGWFCTQQRRLSSGMPDTVELVSVCLTDCRLGGCGREGVCNLETGICELMLEDPDACEYPCQANENCTEGRCLRADNSCDTDYHCAEDFACVDGACAKDSFAPCDALNDPCADGQICVRAQDNTSFCLYTCVGDPECPLNMACQDLLGPGQPSICYYEFCEANQLNGQCTLGGSPAGTCRPLPAASNSAGICLQGGTSPVGSECDSTADPRNADETALGCASGSLCFGDTDDPFDPANMNEDRGVCRSLCTVGQPGCGEDEACVQLGSPDDPSTPENELFNYGVCFESDCILFGGECGEGSTCQPISFSANFGQCRTTGDRGLGEACQDDTDCGPNTLCGNAGNGLVCISFCNLRNQDCPWGQSCIPIGGGAVNACL